MSTRTRVGLDILTSPSSLARKPNAREITKHIYLLCSYIYYGFQATEEQGLIKSLLYYISLLIFLHVYIDKSLLWLVWGEQRGSPLYLARIIYK